MGCYIAACVIPAVVLLWMMISPRSLWKSFSWQYRNPDALEPSDTAYAVNRVLAGVGLIALVVIGGIVSSAINSADESQERRDYQNEQIDYQDCLDRNRDEEGSLTPEQWCKNLSPSPTP